MKASHFVRAFEKEVDCWERRLSLVMEVIEMVLTVQRQWIYLEVRSTSTRVDHPSGDHLHTHLCLAAELSLNVDSAFLFSEHIEHFSRQRYPGAAAT